jgi:hypothetical protein
MYVVSEFRAAALLQSRYLDLVFLHPASCPLLAVHASCYITQLLHATKRGARHRARSPLGTVQEPASQCGASASRQSRKSSPLVDRWGYRGVCVCRTTARVGACFFGVHISPTCASQSEFRVFEPTALHHGRRFGFRPFLP